MKNSIFLILLLFTFSFIPNVYSQSKKAKDKIVMPEFPGGVKALHQFIASEVCFPAEARRNNEIGEVLVGFIVGIDGSISNVRVLKSVSESLDKEAVRVITQIKYMLPGKKNGIPMRTELSIPINFKLYRSHDKYVDEDDSQATENIIRDMLH